MSSFAKQLSISVIISYTFSISAWYLYTYYIKGRSNRIPTKWKRVGRVGKIILYPLKAGASREVTEAICTDMGLREMGKDSSACARHLFRDRSFVVYKHSNEAEDNQTTNQNESLNKATDNPRTLLISIDSIDTDQIVLKAPNVENFVLKLSHVKSLCRRVRITNYGVITFDAMDCGDEVAKWLTNYYGKENETSRLGYYAENIIQRPDPISSMLKIPKFATTYKHWRKNDGGVFSHLTSYMILSSSSIQDLNDRLTPENQFSYRNLRGNILVEGSEKYAEDEWKWIRIGENVVFRTVKPCTRCITITTDPDTAERNKDMEPLKTLRTYRTVRQLTGLKCEGDKGVLGILVGLYTDGEIHSGDPVYVDV